MDSKVFPVQFLILLHKHGIPIPVLDEKLNHIVQQLLPFPHLLNILLLDFIKKSFCLKHLNQPINLGNKRNLKIHPQNI